MFRKESMEYLTKKESIGDFVITSTIAILTLANNEAFSENVIIYIIPMFVILLGITKTISMESRLFGKRRW